MANRLTAKTVALPPLSPLAGRGGNMQRVARALAPYSFRRTGRRSSSVVARTRPRIVRTVPITPPSA